MPPSARPRVAVCVVCGHLFVANSSGIKRSTCGANCKRVLVNRANTDRTAAKARAAGRVPEGGSAHCPLPGCIRTFTKRGAQKFCCDEHLRFSMRGGNGVLCDGDWLQFCVDCDAFDVPLNASYRCAACSRRRERARYQRKNLRRRGAGGEPLSALEIAARDGSACHLCGESVDIELSGMLPDGPSVDHVLPLSRGGTNDPANLALAHRSCNVRRGNRELAA